jgi:hypothetical protein
MMDIIANVTIRGETCVMMIKKPLQKPMKRANTITRVTTGKTIDSRPQMSPVVKHVVRLITDPTERSIPALKRTRVCPMLTIPSATA